jgi:signal transduction histidine kinase
MAKSNPIQNPSSSGFGVVSRTPGSELKLWLWVAIAVACIHSLLTIFGFGAWRLELGSAIRLLNAPIAIVTMFLATRHYTRGRATTYWLMAGATVWALGDALYGYVEVIARADVNQATFLGGPYILSVFALLIAVLCLPQQPRSRTEVLSMWSETLIVIVASVTAMWRGFIAQNLVDQHWNWIAVVYDLIGPFIGMGIFGYLFLTVLRQRERILAAYNWLALGVVCYGSVLQGADFIRGQGGKYFTGHPIDSLSSWGAVFLLTAVLSGLGPRKPQNRILTQFWAGSLTVLPYLAVVGNYAMLFAFITRREYDPTAEVKEVGLLIGVGVVTALVVIRQLLMIRENKNLNDSLERRVAERGQQLEISQSRLNASERLASLGQLTAGLAHEVNTPLASAMNGVSQAQNLAREYHDSIGAPGVTNQDHLEIAKELDSSLSQVTATLHRLGELIRKMRAQGRNQNEGAVRFNPVQTAQDALVMLDHASMQAKVELLLEPGLDAKALLIHGDPLRFSQVVTNLTQNAIHACEDRRKPEGSRVRVFFSSDADFVTLHVSDNGSGIPEKIVARIFDPLFTTKETGRGTGLGLAIIRDIVTGHLAGEITLETELDQGTTFNVRLKRVPAEPELGGVQVPTLEGAAR